MTLIPLTSDEEAGLGLCQVRQSLGVSGTVYSGDTETKFQRLDLQDS